MRHLSKVNFCNVLQDLHSIVIMSEISTQNRFPTDLWYSSILIPLFSPVGEELFRKSLHRRYDHLYPHFEGQEQLSYCGIACTCILLKSLLPSKKWSQSSIYSSVVRYEMFHGIILSKLSHVLEVCGLHSEIRYCEDEKVEENFRNDLENDKSFIVINYWRQFQDKETSATHQYGHFSLIGGYNSLTDHVLILDPSVKRFPHHWLSLKDLVRLMCTYDPMSSRNRGYLLVHHPDKLFSF